MIDISAKIKELLLEEADPRGGAAERTERAQRRLLGECPPVVGTVTDNRDPECLGRVRISLDALIPGGESTWLPVAGESRKRGAGMWVLPEIGTQALAVFTAADRSEGYILGFIYDIRHRPPERPIGSAVERTILQTKSHRIEIIDGGKSEDIWIESAEGRMRIAIGKSGGIKIENGLGGINIKCRSLKAESEGIELKGKKKVALDCDGSISSKIKKTVGIASDKEVNLKGKNIRLSGTKGVTAEGKQMAAQGDRVTGFDVHVMVVPSGSGTMAVPLPHPFIGKISGNVSGNVKIKDKGAATKGSVARHDDAVHMQLPGTIKFQMPPKKEGEVTGGTSGKVKINGKEAAVIGSLVSTCNDVGAKDNSTVIASGASMPMPVIVSPLSTGGWERRQEEQERKEPKLTNVKWASTSVMEGEETELTASVQDIADGNMVTLQVFREGQSPESDAPLAKFPLTVRSGSVSAKWLYRASRREMPPERDPRFIFSAHCAWCKFEKSSNILEVRLARPEITKAEWRDKDGKAVAKGLAGEPLKLHAETKDMEGGVTFRVYDGSLREVFSSGADIVDGKAEAEWNPVDNRLPDDTSELKYKFEVTGSRCKKTESGECQIKNPRVVSMEWNKKAVYYGDKAALRIRTFELSDEKPVCKLQLWKKNYTEEDDFILEQDITIGKDVVETEIEFNFSLRQLNVKHSDYELIIAPILKINGYEPLILQKSNIRVGIGFINE